MSPGSDRSRRGVLLVLAGTSGAGKGTIGSRLRAVPGMGWSVSWTTRVPRDGEVDGVDYHFVSLETFERAREQGEFLESFSVFGNLYGTPRRPIAEHLERGHDVLVEVDVQGALAIKDAMPDAVLVFVAAPSRDEQRRRLERRGQDAPEAVERRLEDAEEEERIARTRFDHLVMNDDLEQAVREVADILETRRAELR